jgi:hypothetical protein
MEKITFNSCFDQQTVLTPTNPRSTQNEVLIQGVRKISHFRFNKIRLLLFVIWFFTLVGQVNFLFEECEIFLDTL